MQTPFYEVTLHLSFAVDTVDTTWQSTERPSLPSYRSLRCAPLHIYRHRTKLPLTQPTILNAHRLMRLSRHAEEFEDKGGVTPTRKQKPFIGIQYYFLVLVSLLLAYEFYWLLFYLLYPTHKLTVDHLLPTDPQRHKYSPDSFSIEIFTAPKPFVGPDKDVSLRAIRSWQNLHPKPTITLLGNEEGYESVAAEYGLQIRSEIDKTFLGVPLFNSMLHVANQSNATVSVIINGDIILLNDFTRTLHNVLNRFRHFLLISARYDLPKLPPSIVEGEVNFYSKLRDYTMQNGALHTYGGMDLWAWNPNGPRLFDQEMPHFIFGRGKYDNWLTHETIAAGRRDVIDASEAVMSIHIRHGYSLVSQNEDEEAVLSGTVRRKLLSTEKMFWSENKKSKFELFVNIFLSLSVGSYKNQYGSILFAPWKLARCEEPDGVCLMWRERPGVCNCEYASSSVATQTDEVEVNGSRVIRCGAVSSEKKQDYTIPVSVAGSQHEYTFGMPLTIKSISEKVAIDNTIIVTALNNGYKGMMMNWVCNMRRLGIRNFVVAALDEDLYRYAFTRGIPTYYENSLGKHVSLRDAAYGTAEFKELTKMKSRVVLNFLKLGYNTLWTDTDIVWFKNPLKNLHGLAVDLAIQSNAPDDEAANGKRRINSGFYLARANGRLIEVFEDVIRYAAKSKMSEQPCFYDVICGKEGERKVGTDGCEYKGTTTKLLDRTLYPNGVSLGMWNVSAGSIESTFVDVMIVHNNWIKGHDAKWERFKRHGYIFHDEATGLCRYQK